MAWLRKFLEHRIADRRILRLIDKWLAAGVVEDGIWSQTERGSRRGHRLRRCSPTCTCTTSSTCGSTGGDTTRRAATSSSCASLTTSPSGFSIVTTPTGSSPRFATRFAKFGLELHPDKTRLIEFGRYAAERRQARGLGKPETFTFLGFTHICATGRRGRFWVRRKTESKRMRAKLKQVHDQLQAAPAFTHPGSGTVAGERAARPLRLLRRSGQRCTVRPSATR